MKKGFYLGPMSHYFLNVLETDSHNQWYRDLSYNMMQSYCGHFDTIADTLQSIGQKDGGFFEDISNYRDSMKKVITKWRNIANDNSLIFEREKILRPAYGQRFTYQAEDPGIGWHTKFPAYGYDDTNVTGSDLNDYWMGENVRSRYCKAGTDTAGFIVKGLYENCSQTNNTKIVPNGTNSSGNDRLYSDIKQPEYNMRWFIKPRMRVDVNTIFSHLNDTLVKIYVKNFSGSYIDSFSIKGLNFLDSNSSYDGQYLENFYNLPTNYNNLSVRSDSLAVGKGSKPYDSSHVDYQVKWLGKVDVWLDYVRVDDSWAHYLFTDTWTEGQIYPPNNMWHFRERIREEVLAFNGTNNGLGYFWVDEVQYPNLECIGEVNKLVKQYSGNKLSLLFITDPIAFMEGAALRNQDKVNQVYWDTCINMAIRDSALTDIMITQWFPFNYKLRYPDVFPAISNYYYIFDKVLKADNYDQYTYVSDQGVQPAISWLMRQHKYFINKAKEKGLIYGVINQINSDENNIKRKDVDWGLREPTNEEISLTLNTSMAYGAKIMLEFSYTSRLQSDSLKKTFNWGLTSTDKDDYLHKRDSNYYGQRKWDFVSALNKKLKQTGDYMYPLNNPNEHLVHDKTITVNPVTYPDCGECGLSQYDFVNDVRSFAPLINAINPCVETNGQQLYYDCREQRYWELGFFKTNTGSSNPNDKNKYVYAVNKRTYPVNIQNNLGDVRDLQIQFNSSNLQGFNNWVVKDAINDSVIVTFNKATAGYISVGRFQPGEGKLLKIAPVMQEGGTLAGDESCSGSFNCNGKVLNNGHNITISHGTSILFSDSAGIEMNGGNFACGLNTYNSVPVTLTGKTGSTYWNGLSLSNCPNIVIYNTNISKIIANGIANAVLITNCNNINISNSAFTVDNNAGAVQAVFTTNSASTLISFNLSYCNFNMVSSGCDAISITSNAAITLPVIVEWCNFNTNNENSNAVMLTNVTGGALKNNTFQNFKTTINTLGATIDLYNNIILGRNNSTGIFCNDGSNITMKPISRKFLGGHNYIKNYGTTSSCITSTNSLFDINTGENNFDLNDTASSKFLKGTLYGFPYLNVNATNNCFHLDSVTNIEANHSVTWYDLTPVNYTFTPFSCILTPPSDFFVLQYNGYSDTIYNSSGGEGGGVNPNKQISIEENVYKSLKDTININLRKRNYLTVEEKTKQILTQFPDSLESIGMVQKLYMASLSLDTTKIGITKTFLENLIVNNTQNPGMVNRAFYFIQKCKVKLGHYQSALDGFQYIMTQNPYTYEGLVASWDYAATYLLMGTGGSYKGDLEQQTEELYTPADTLLNRMTKQDINTNKGTSSTANEQMTKTFYEKIKNVTKDDKSIQEAKIKTLEKKIETTKSKNEKNDAVKELATMKQIKETVKIKKPNTVQVHISMMNDDIKKVFGIGKGSKDESKNNLIPTTYNLYQNYPNPFNPTTKIAYDIPRDAKVKLVIYDILGREVKMLVNNEFKTAGKYITEFNGSYLASGIYFARILVNEGKEFVAVKKLVLLK